MTALAGIAFLDHTADVGIALQAPTLECLFHRGAMGMLALLRGEEDEEPPEAASPAGAGPAAAAEVTIALRADSAAALMADWLRELLFLHEIDHRDYAGAEFDRLEPTALRARVRTEPWAGAVREIKGVTYHDLSITREGSVWKGRVIFDV